VKSRLIGILAIFNKRENSTFSEDDKRLVSIIAAQSGQVLENARLYEQERSLLVVQEQIRLASRIQTDLLPKQAPAIAGYDIAGRTIPAQMVGGDYFDFIPIDDHRLAICLGDVSGKGLPASLLMANLQATLRAQSMTNETAKGCIVRSNSLLYQSTSDEKFATLFYGILDSHSHELLFCNAGHDPPFLIRSSGETRRLKTGGIVLSMMDSFPYDEEVVSLAPGDVLVLYSDGITESMNANEEMYGEDTLSAILHESCHLPAGDIIEKTISAVKHHAGPTPQSDDLTMIAIRRTTA
jgi:sigma-B regulation protein RsbU (phosphoserine phosphatase)